MNILMAGTGGQGIILASDILAEVMMRSGCDVKKSEIHGMAQRGGSVMSHVRYSKEVYSPIIPLEECDILLSFEELETARYMAYLNKNSTVIINRCRVSPPSVIAGKDKYPDVTPIIKQKTGKIHFVNGNDMAGELENPRGVNLILLGVLSTLLEPEESLWVGVLSDMLKEKIRAVNIEGFLKGRAVKSE
ncbi:MAG: indolepyruvate oxidoreductase subunit beta [Deltaproteobacteria bacterium]|nr:indolepyruvate oxidoreductase subunit beta [Deltaproteobacteria bacterium]